MAAPSAWWQEDVNGAGETHCGGSCAQSQLECVRSVMPGTSPDLATIADENAVPWGQIDFWLANKLLDDRPDLFRPDSALGGGRASAPQLLARGVEVDYDLAVEGRPVAAIVRLWPDKAGMASLRCVYLPGEAGIEAHIDELID